MDRSDGTHAVSVHYVGAERVKPSLSIVTPVLNRRAEVERMLDSILAQDKGLLEVEIIVVDDDSEDGTYEFLKKRSEDVQNLKVLRSGLRSVGYSRNLGVRAASHEWVLLLDSDNVLVEGIFQLIASTLTDLHATQFDGVWFACVDEDNRLMSWDIEDTSDWVVLDRTTYFTKVRKREMVHCLRRRWFRENPYPVVKGASIEFADAVWLRLVFAGRLIYRNVVVQRYARKRQDSLSNAGLSDKRMRELLVYSKLVLEMLLDEGEIWNRLFLENTVRFLLLERASQFRVDLSTRRMGIRVMATVARALMKCMTPGLARVFYEYLRRNRAESLLRHKNQVSANVTV